MRAAISSSSVSSARIFCLATHSTAKFKGDLAFDGSSGLVIATDATKSSIAFDLDGVVRYEWPELSSDIGWRFFPEQRCFARPAEAVGVEERAFLAG